MIDDWNGASRGASSLVDLLAPFVERPVLRFRPGFDLFDHIEWHTLGAPHDMTGPNLWNAVRLALFVAAVGVVPALVARAVAPDLSSFTLGALTAVPPAVVVTGGVISVDLARLAPQEPMLVGATVCGAALVLFGLDRYMSGARMRKVLLPTVIGWPLYVLGATSKEASMSFLAVTPFLYLFLAQRWRELGCVRGLWEPLRRPGAIAFATALLVPLLWVAFRAATIGGEGADLYQRGKPHGLDGWIDRLEEAGKLQWNSMITTLGSPLWRALAVSLPFLALGIWADRRRVPWVAVGLVLGAGVMLVVQGLPAVVTSRYFLPTMALLTMAATLLLAQGRAWLRWTALVAGSILVISGAAAARQAVTGWATDEKATSELIERVALLAQAGCRLHQWGLDVERAEALPRLVGLQMKEASGSCPLGTATLVVTSSGAAPDSVGNVGLWRTCREPWKHELDVGAWAVVGCARSRARIGREAVEEVLNQNRLVPGVGPGERAACLEHEPRIGVCNRARLKRGDPWP